MLSLHENDQNIQSFFFQAVSTYILLSLRNPIRKECVFIKVDPVTFWGLSVNVGLGEAKRWKVKC